MDKKPKVLTLLTILDRYNERLRTSNYERKAKLRYEGKRYKMCGNQKKKSKITIGLEVRIKEQIRSKHNKTTRDDPTYKEHDDMT